MYYKECRICGDNFWAKTERRELCDKCQQNPTRAQKAMDNQLLRSKARTGELANQQYYHSQCKYCGKEIHSYGRIRYFCSTECQQQHTAENATCRVCSAPLFPLGIIAKNGQGCCSEACAEKHRLNVARESGKLGVCKVCKREFIKKNEYDEDLCGAVCADKYKWFVARQNGKVGKCGVCGKEFIKKDWSNSTTCSAVCYNESLKLVKPVMSTCMVCGKEFERHPNSKQLVCGKMCRSALDKKKREAGRLERQKEAQDIRTRKNTERERLVKKVLSGKLVGKDAHALHLCTCCKTSQAECIFFTSHFRYHPKGAVIRAVDMRNIVLVCPDFNI